MWCLVMWLAAVSYADDIEGRYWNPDHTRQVEVKLNEGLLTGTIVWVKTPEQHDQLGQTILRDFQRAGDRWMGGTVVSPVNGRVYSGTVWLEAGDLMMRGYVGLPVFGRTARLERVECLPTSKDSHCKL